MRRNFTTKFIDGLRPGARRVEHWDLKIPSFGVRVSRTGLCTYILYVRWPGKKSPTRRKIGRADRISLAQAREVAREWLAQVELRVDPRQRIRAAEAEAARAARVTFAVVAEAWLRDKAHLRKAAEMRTDVLREFVAPWGKKPITEITTLDVVSVIRAKKDQGHPAQARNLLGYAKGLFDWAVEQHVYGLEKSPAEPISGLKLIGKKNKRRRYLTIPELRAVWHAAQETPYPYGPLIRMLLLTGQRKSEVGDATWSEIDLVNRVWTVPAERMKMEEPHVVPITDDLATLLASLPRHRGGDYLFTTNFGRSPANGYSKAKERLDKITGPMPHWTFHDLRRTMRTYVADLVPENVGEAMIAHAPKGIVGNYVLYKFQREKREGFELWHARLRTFLQQETGNVVALRG